MPNKIELSVSANHKGYLVVSDNHHPAWKANIDGEKAKILLANYIMRAIPITAGSHKVILTFDTKLRLGWLISVVGWLVLLMSIVLSFCYERKESRNGNEENLVR
jgi:uncharacterized membrane protein YfhO